MSVNTDALRALANRPGVPIESTSEFRAALFDAAEEIDRLRVVGSVRNPDDGAVNADVITRARAFAMVPC